VAVRHKRRHSTRPRSRHISGKAYTAAAAAEYGVPFWLLWGIAGAESTWGRGGTNLFGLLAAAEGVNTGSWPAASKQAAKTLRGLHDQYGSWSLAVSHYSGNSYTIGHPKELAKQEGVTPSNSTAVQKRIFADIELPLLPDVPFPGPDVHIPSIPGMPHVPGIPTVPEDIPGTKGFGDLFSFPGELLQASTAVTALFSMLTDVNFWIRAGTAIGSLILIYLGLHSLTGQGPSVSEGRQLATAVAAKGL
jgi:hypothetical protein